MLFNQKVYIKEDVAFVAFVDYLDFKSINNFGFIYLIRNEDNANLTASPYSTFGGRYSKSEGGPASILKKRGEERLEAKNEEVIRRVVEMQHILQVKTFS